MTDRLRKILLSIDFKNRYDSLFNKHSHKNLFKEANPNQIQKIIENLGYICVYHKSDKFFKIDHVQSNLSLNLSTDLGIVEFIQDTTVEGVRDGGPFDYMCTLISNDQNLKAPRFGTYEELTEILLEGLKLYEDIKKGLFESQT